MNDKMQLRFLKTTLLTGSALFLGLAGPAHAGEDILYTGVPDWVDEATLDQAEAGEGPSQLVADWQYWLEDGVVTSYGDSASRIDNPQALMEQGTITLSWLPDKGDLTIHRVEILRGDEKIDVIADGAEFEIIRREQGLEQRLLDGELTATLAVPGLQVGDVLRVTHSVTTDDQALGDEMQVLQYLGTEPWQVGFARTIVSWPEDEEVYWRAEDHAELADPVTKGGVRKLEVTLPLAEMEEMPSDAPWRFRRNPVLRVGTYADWGELSRTMEPHFTKAAQIDTDGPIAEQARKIMAKTDDPLRRAALATQLVQDEVSYLLNGLDGGNYLPQTAEETWEKRYGDCKAKSVLLHALLNQMGIQSQTVLVKTRGGDAVPELLPLPGNFDHMIVRAQIDGEDYWLDGTSAATRIGNIGWIPAFYYALPLTEAGADLVAMGQREQTTPNTAMSIVMDYSAGIDLPPLFDLEMKFFGPQSAGIQKLVDEADEEQLRRIGKSFASSQGSGAVSSVEVDYNAEDAFGIIRINGVSASDFEWKDGRLVSDPDMSPDAALNSSRAKPEWRDIPVATRGPLRNRIAVEVVLPQDAGAFEYEGEPTVEARYANTIVSTANRLSGNRYFGDVDVVQTLGEIAPDQLPAAKRAVRRLASQESRLIAPEDIVWRWEVEPKKLAKRSEALLDAYTKAIEFADEDDFGPLEQRADFFFDTNRFQEALVDLNQLVEKNTSAWVLNWRSNVHNSLGNTAEAIADKQRAYDIEPDNGTAMGLANLMAYAGQITEARELLESLPISDDETSSYAGSYSTVIGLSGDLDGGLDVLADEVADKPQNSTALNNDCWYRGLFNFGLEGALSVCTRAIERADNGAAMLDSRAMVHYRLGDYEAALADLDSALELSPGLSNSLLLKGIILLEQGDKSGKDQVTYALRLSPELKGVYEQHGFTFD